MRSAAFGYLARYGSLIFALQRTNALFRPIGRNNEFMRSAAFGYLARYGSLIFALQRTNILFRPIGRNNEFMRSAAFGYLARYGSLIFALQRTNAFAPRLLVISLAMDRSSLLCKEPTLSLRGFWLSRSLWIAR
ncbi:hypothetical protein [Leptospira santarosai]|uniref:hypothetical protein n=1 Tax=Leptospira santarosai TaxID=28183 RepID=UPI0018DEECDC|nr:hypothetical protein [Leptospira santarosai]